MPLEIAFIPVHPDHVDTFHEVATQSMTDLFPKAPGFVRGEVRRGIEQPDMFALLLEWETIEYHTEGFVNSDLFTEWVRRTDGMASGNPVVEHWDLACS